MFGTLCHLLSIPKEGKGVFPGKTQCHLQRQEDSEAVTWSSAGHALPTPAAPRCDPTLDAAATRWGWGCGQWLASQPAT